MTIQMKATEQYLPVVLFVTLFKVLLILQSVDEILKCDTFKQAKDMAKWDENKLQLFLGTLFQG